MSKYRLNIMNVASIIQSAVLTRQEVPRSSVARRYDAHLIVCKIPPVQHVCVEELPPRTPSYVSPARPPAARWSHIVSSPPRDMVMSAAGSSCRTPRRSSCRKKLFTKTPLILGRKDGVRHCGSRGGRKGRLVTDFWEDGVADPGEERLRALTAAAAMPDLGFHLRRRTTAMTPSTTAGTGAYSSGRTQTNTVREKMKKFLIIS